MPRTDVLVVGAGPAGATAAFHTARGGLSTLLIDRRTFPRPKVCGDGVTPRALRALDRMGVVDDALVTSRILGLRMIGDERRATYHFADEPPPFTYAAVVPRVLLDDRIRRAAEGAGAVFRDDLTALDLATDSAGHVRGVWVGGPAGRALLEADLTIVADGAAGRLGRRLRGEPATGSYSGFALRRYWDDVADLEPYLEFHVPLRWRGQVLVGYGWVFPVSASRANVGVGILAEPAHTDRARLPEVLAAFAGDLMRRDPRFAGARPVSEVEAGPVNSHMIDPTTVPPGALLVGDAAGLVNPFTAEGIAYALESGELAARTAVHALPRRRTPTVDYGRALVASVPRHWATRAGSRHFRWLIALVPRLFDVRASNGLARTLRQFVFDQSTPRTRVLMPETAEWLHLSVRHRAADVVRSTDRMFAELVAQLLADPHSAPGVPLAAAAIAAAQTGSNGAALVDALAAVTLLALAESLLDDVNPATHTDDALAHAAIVLADCVTTDAIALLAGLSDVTYRHVTTAFREAAGARLERAVDGATPPAMRFPRLAAPTRCAVTLVLEAMHRLDLTAAAEATAPFATWYAATQLATAELRRGWAPDVASYLHDVLAGPPSMPPSWTHEAWHDMVSTVVRDAQTVLGASATRRSAAATTSR